MIGRWLFIAVVALGVVAYMHAHRSDAVRADLTQACDSSDPARVVATIVWPAATTAEQTFLDMSDTNDFREGAYSSHGPLPAPATSFTLEGLAMGATYFYRVRVIRDAAAQTIAAGSFVAECPRSEATAAA